jgi:hypothetical protein
MPPALTAAALEDYAASYGASVLDLTVSLLPRPELRACSISRTATPGPSCRRPWPLRTSPRRSRRTPRSQPCERVYQDR